MVTTCLLSWLNTQEVADDRTTPMFGDIQMTPVFGTLDMTTLAHKGGQTLSGSVFAGIHPKNHTEGAPPQDNQLPSDWWFGLLVWWLRSNFPSALYKSQRFKIPEPPIQTTNSGYLRVRHKRFENRKSHKPDLHSTSIGLSTSTIRRPNLDPGWLLPSQPNGWLVDSLGYVSQASLYFFLWHHPKRETTFNWPKRCCPM